MVTLWMEALMENLADPEQDLDLFNTKEDAEVLKGLFIGRYAYEQFHDTHIIKKAKMYDLL